MNAERRKAQREATFQPVWLLVGPKGKMIMRDAFLLDASPLGVRIQVGAPLVPREIVGYIAHAGLSAPIPCEVKWVGRETSGRRGEAGLEFMVPN
ncbi:MAG TPA: hypothetical protein VFD30_00620 [Terriglobia bacterium]|jgi:hypothetical protein|nr:hypothetical protein [Terriglobia bacterium]